MEIKMVEIASKVAVITGGGSGIGLGIALALAAAGADSVIADINLKNAETVVKEIQTLGRRATAFKCDVTSESQCGSAGGFCVGRDGPC